MNNGNGCYTFPYVANFGSNDPYLGGTGNNVNNGGHKVEMVDVVVEVEIAICKVNFATRLVMWI